MRYLCCDPGCDPEHWVAVSGRSIEDAAKEFARMECQIDSENYSVYSDGVEVVVYDGALHRVEVNMEMSPHFHASDSSELGDDQYDELLALAKAHGEVES